MSKKAIFTFGTVVVAVAILAVAIPLFFPARVITTSYPCVNNLRIIEESKEQWALDKYKTTNDVPSWDDLRPYFPNGWTNGRPVCPEGGTYTLGRVGVPPTCSIGGPGHSLPQ